MRDKNIEEYIILNFPNYCYFYDISILSCLEWLQQNISQFGKEWLWIFVHNKKKICIGFKNSEHLLLFLLKFNLNDKLYNRNIT